MCGAGDRDKVISPPAFILWPGCLLQQAERGPPAPAAMLLVVQPVNLPETGAGLTSSAGTPLLTAILVKATLTFEYCRTVLKAGRAEGSNTVRGGYVQAQALTVAIDGGYPPKPAQTETESLRSSVITCDTSSWQ